MAFKGDLEALVLGVLQDGDLHGYEISKRIKLISAKALQVGEGQLYPALHKLEKDGHVSATWIPQDGKPPRKVYALTDEGRKELSSHRKSWEAFSVGVEALLNPRTPVAEGGRG
jgi:PadR family transcriptional regulator PadR